jgi:putative ABC transport system permease protein
MTAFARDVRFACRLLAARPGWTLAAVLCLAIATGANTAAFSVVNALILRPLPFEDPGRLIMVALRDPERGTPRPFSLSEYRDFAARTGGSVALTARTFLPLSLVADDGARMVEAEFVSANYFTALRVAPHAGVFPAALEGETADRAAVVISHAIWQRRFGGDPAIVGRLVRINARPFVVSAVAPRGFVGATRLIAADLWMPASLYSAMARAGDAEQVPMFGVMGRMAAGLDIDEVRTRLETIGAGVWRDRATAPPPGIIVDDARGFGVPPAVRGTVARGSALIFGLMGLLIAVAAANVAALVLARATGRHMEVGVRLALGASRWRIARQMLTESLVLAAVGGAAGWALAGWATRVLAAQSATRFEYVSYAVDIRPDLRVLAYTAAAVLGTAILFGLAPVWHASRVDLIDVLKRSSSSGRKRLTAHTLRGLVVGQLAVSTALLVGCGLLVRTYRNAQAVPPGIETGRIVTASVDLSQLDLQNGEGRRFFEDVRARVAALPGVAGTSLTRHAPLSPSGSDVRVVADRIDGGAEPSSVAAGAEVVTAEHFRMLGIPIVQGRGFRDLEPERPLAAIVNETLARRLSPNGSAIGRSFRVAGGSGERLEIVGVAADIKYRSVTETPRAVFYQPFSQSYSPRMTLLVQVQGRPADLVHAVGQAIRAANGDLAIQALGTLDDQRDAAMAFRRQVTISLGLVCAVGLLLSSLGLYGVVSYSVRERAREFGIRTALGARAADVQWMVIRQGLRVTALGLVVGVALSLALTGVLRTLLFGVGPRDPLTIAVVAAVLVAVSAAALYLPARWATTVDPATVLRSE